MKCWSVATVWICLWPATSTNTSTHPGNH